MLTCLKCQASLMTFSSICPICKSSGTIFNLPKECLGYINHRRVGIKNKNHKTLEDIKKIKIDTNEIIGYEFLGKIPKSAKISVYGNPGGGKSSFCLKFLNEVSKQKKVLSSYICIEEKPCSFTFKEKIDRLGIDSKYLVFAEDILNLCENFVIDSLDTAEIANLKGLNSKGLSIYISQITKSKKQKGSASIPHDVDVLLKAQDGVIYVEKNRLGFCDPSQPVFNIW